MAGEKKRKPVSKPRGRPKGKVLRDGDADTMALLRELANIQCTQGEAAAVLGVEITTLEKFLRDSEKARTTWDSGQHDGKASLRRTMFRTAHAGNATLQIWLSKQHLGMRDSIDHNVNAAAEALEMMNAAAKSAEAKLAAKIASQGEEPSGDVS